MSHSRLMVQVWRYCGPHTPVVSVELQRPPQVAPKLRYFTILRKGWMGGKYQWLWTTQMSRRPRCDNLLRLPFSFQFGRALALATRNNARCLLLGARENLFRWGLWRYWAGARRYRQGNKRGVVQIKKAYGMKKNCEVEMRRYPFFWLCRCWMLVSRLPFLLLSPIS